MLIKDQAKKLYYLIIFRGDRRDVPLEDKIKGKVELMEALGYKDAISTATRLCAGDWPEMHSTLELNKRHYPTICKIFDCDQVSFIEDEFNVFKSKCEERDQNLDNRKLPEIPDFGQLVQEATRYDLGHIYKANPHSSTILRGDIGLQKRHEGTFEVGVGQPFWFEFGSQKDPNGRRNKCGGWHILLVEISDVNRAKCFVPITDAKGWQVKQFPSAERLLLPTREAVTWEDSKENHTLFAAGEADIGRTFDMHLISTQEKASDELIGSLRCEQLVTSYAYQSLVKWLAPLVKSNAAAIASVKYKVSAALVPGGRQ